MSGYSDAGYQCHVDWGITASIRAAERGDILVIVDVLSFSTSVIAAVSRGAVIYPCPMGHDRFEYAARVGAEAAVRRKQVPEKGRFSLSALTYQQIEPGTRVVLPSPNGGTCSYEARHAPYLFVGALTNAEAAADAVMRLIGRENRRVSVIACGERVGLPSGQELRWAVEDYLGAGAILSFLMAEKSPEARACEAAFRGCRDGLYDALWGCESGRELREHGFEKDIEYAAQLNFSGCVPTTRGEFFEAL